MITKDYTIFKLSADSTLGRLTSFWGNDRILGMNNFFDLAKKKIPIQSKNSDISK